MWQMVWASQNWAVAAAPVGGRREAALERAAGANRALQAGSGGMSPADARAAVIRRPGKRAATIQCVPGHRDGRATSDEGSTRVPTCMNR